MHVHIFNLQNNWTLPLLQYIMNSDTMFSGTNLSYSHSESQEYNDT